MCVVLSKKEGSQRIGFRITLKIKNLSELFLKQCFRLHENQNAKNQTICKLFAMSSLTLRPTYKLKLTCEVIEP